MTMLNRSLVLTGLFLATILLSLSTALADTGADAASGTSVTGQTIDVLVAGENKESDVESEEDEDDEEGKKDKDEDKGCKEHKPFYNSDWFSKMDFSGELEFRYTEETFDDDTTEFARDYGAYFSITAEPARDWEFSLGLKTGRDHHPTSSWIEDNDLDSTRLLWLREYWIRHEMEPVKDDEFRIQAGRFNYPFDATQLVFDSDLYFPGAYARYRWDIDNSDLERVEAAVMHAQLRDRKAGDAGPALITTMQLGTRWEPDKQRRFDAAVSHHWLGGLDTIGTAIAAGDWRVGGVSGIGETTNYWDQVSSFDSGYELLDIYFEGEWQRETEWPVELELEWIRNLAAAGRGSREDIAWFAGLSIGPDGDPGDVQFGVEHVRIESDSVFAAINRGEYGSNYEGTLAEVNFTPVEHVEWTLAYGWSNSIKDQLNGLDFDNEELRFYMTIDW